MPDFLRSGSQGAPHTPDPCRVCGGDGRIDNTFGQVGRCPSCHGTGRRSEDTGFHDVTKTKASHHHPTNRAPVAAKDTWPVTPSGIQLATEIRDTAGLKDDSKAKMIREVIDHEATHGSCTQTFIKKMRKQFRAPAPR